VTEDPIPSAHPTAPSEVVPLAPADLLKESRPTVVIVGAGFGGLAAARGLSRAPVRVVVIDRRNHHLFQPLLYQVATAVLSPADIAPPIRSILRRQRNAEVHLASMTGVDLADHQIMTDRRPFHYDQLVIATGAGHSYFGHDDWARYAPGLKSIEDATEIRRDILLAFELAEDEADPKRREMQMTFVIVGGGSTGVEIAGALAELAKQALRADFRVIDPSQARIVLIEAGPRLLPTFPKEAGEVAKRDLHHLGVEVRLGKPVTAIDDESVTFGDETLAARTKIWAAGVAASPAARWLGVPSDRAGRIFVTRELTIPDHPEVFVIGDTAFAVDENANPLPGTAQAARQEGGYVARVIASRARKKSSPGRFHYRHLGDMTTIGRNRAIADFGKVRFYGFVGWLLWSIVHIALLIGFRNRLVVGFEWLWSYLTFQRGARLITEPCRRELRIVPAERTSHAHMDENSGFSPYPQEP
jgi:NADH dehydrogenase